MRKDLVYKIKFVSSFIHPHHKPECCNHKFHLSELIMFMKTYASIPLQKV